MSYTWQLTLLCHRVTCVVAAGELDLSLQHHDGTLYMTK